MNKAEEEINFKIFNGNVSEFIRVYKELLELITFLEITFLRKRTLFLDL